MTDVTERLRATPLASDLDAATCASLAALGEASRVEGESSLFEAGSDPDFVYIVLSGELRVVMRTEKHREDLVIAVLGPGGVVGELELFTQSPHVASVVATESTECLRLPMAAVRNPPAEHREAMAGFVFEIAKVLATRLAAVNAKLLAAWGLPEAGAEAGDLSAPALRDVLNDVWQW